MPSHGGGGDVAKMLRRRAMIVSEFVSTEETYVSNLQLLVDRFSNTLHGVIAPADHLSIFSIAPQLVLDINTHPSPHHLPLTPTSPPPASRGCALLRAAHLEPAAVQGHSQGERWRPVHWVPVCQDGALPENVPTGRVPNSPPLPLTPTTLLCKHLCVWHASRYSQYVDNHENATNVVKRLRADVVVAETISAVEAKTQALDSFLIMPVQRVPRYLLLLRELEKYTPTSHVDYADVKVPKETPPLALLQHSVAPSHMTWRHPCPPS